MTEIETIAKRAGIKPGQSYIVEIRPTKQDELGYFMPWTIEDIDLEDTVTVTPSDCLKKDVVTGLVTLDVNGLQYAYKPGVEVAMPRYFYNVYKNLEDQYIELEDLKAHGPRYKHDDPEGRYKKGDVMQENWQYKPEVISFVLDIDGNEINTDLYTYEQNSHGIYIKTGRKE